MSFDLYVFPPPAPTTLDEVHRLMDEMEARFESGGPQPTPGQEMQAFLTELDRRWPSLDDDPDHSPWAFWPLWQPIGTGTALNIVWSQADTMPAAVLAVASKLRLTVFEPQAGLLIPPAVL